MTRKTSGIPIDRSTKSISIKSIANFRYSFLLKKDHLPYLLSASSSWKKSKIRHLTNFFPKLLRDGSRKTQKLYWVGPQTSFFIAVINLVKDELSVSNALFCFILWRLHSTFIKLWRVLFCASMGGHHYWLCGRE